MHIKFRRHKSILTSKPKKSAPFDPFDGLEGEVRRMRPDTLTIRPEYKKDHPENIKLRGLPKPKFYY